mmetsp:Transcript_14172/g.40306  ORF Transcript_14172/g.40306 Transcript_14172/m.40306 type:complete len:318 (-) Transcript_14172:242-1195(-)
MHRPPREGAPCAHGEYFATRTRRWEMRIQGRFRSRPTGTLFAGCVLQDFDYSAPLSWLASWLGGLSLAPLERLLGARLHFTFGDRCEAATTPDAELAHIVGELAVFDQIVVTEAGEAPPPICGELEGLGVRRSAAASAAEWSALSQEVSSTIDPEKTYTFCFWSASRFIDLIGEKLVNLIPLFPSVGLRTSILGMWPAHFVLYSLEPGLEEANATDSNEATVAMGDAPIQPCRHLEARKRYFVDLMVLNQSLLSNKSLIHRYKFGDAPSPPAKPSEAAASEASTELAMAATPGASTEAASEDTFGFASSLGRRLWRG